MNLEMKLFQLQFNNKKKASFLTQLHNLVDAGVPAPNALRHMRIAYKTKKDKVMAMVAEKMSNNAAQGKHVALDMEDWFPFAVCKILCTAEFRGILTEGLDSSITYLKSGARFLKPMGRTVSGLFYVVALLIAIAIVGHKYIPMIGHFVKTWPSISLTFYHFANFLYYYFALIILVIVGLIFWIVWSIRNYQHNLFYIVALPFMRLYNARCAFDMLEVTALLSANGVSVPEILTILTSQHTRGYLAKRYQIMDARIRAGVQNMGEVIDTGLFTDAQISELHLISRFVDEKNHARIFKIMSKNIAGSIIESLTLLATAISAICLIITGLGIIWIYGSYALLAASFS